MDVFQISVTAKLASPSQMWFYDLQWVRQRWHARVNLCRLKHFEALPPWCFVHKKFSLHCYALCFMLLFYVVVVVVVVPCRAAAVKMQAAAALTVLSVFFSLDGLSAHRSEPDQTQHQNDRNAQTDGTEPEKKNQPHIVFILIDDQVCVCVCYRVCVCWRI